MSVQAITWALSVRAGSPSAKCVLLALANYANESGVCWPSQERLAEETDQSVDSVQRRLKDLDDGGLISRQERGLRQGTRAVTVYTLMMSGVRASAPQDTTPQFAAPQSAAPQIEGSDTALLRHQEPLIEPSIDAADDAGARRPSKSLISLEAFALSDDLMRLQRLEKDEPRYIGTAYAVQAWLTKGWDPDLIRSTVEIVMARRTEAPAALRYFEKAIAQAHAERNRPLPVAVLSSGPESLGNRKNATHRNGGGGFALNAIEFARRACQSDRLD